MTAFMQHWPLRVTRLIDHAAREHSTREIVTYWQDGTHSRVGWADIAHDARRCAQAMQRLGVQRGDRVATLAMNHQHHLSSWYGIIGAGAVVHTLNPRLAPEQLVYVMNHGGDTILLYDAMFEPLVNAIRPALPNVRQFICFDRADGYAALIGAEDGVFDWVDGDENEPCMLCYTSGTTGNPKGVMYEHRSSMLHAMTLVTPDAFCLAARSVTLPIVPMFHAASWGLPFSAPMVGCKIVFSTIVDPALLCRLMADEKVTHFAGVPTVWLGLFQYLDATGAPMPSLEIATIGGAAAPRSMIARLVKAGIDVRHAWGMTETSPMGTINAPTGDWAGLDEEAVIDRRTRQGRAPFGVELRTCDDAGNPIPRDGETPGQLYVRGDWTVARYFGTDADATDADGWFDTGDVAVMFPDGSMQLTDRSKDMIKSGGEWISSVDLENAAMGHADVAEAAAIAIPDAKWDERPALIVVRKPDSGLDADTLRTWLAGHVVKWWLPDHIVFVDSLPHTATGKVLKSALREQYASLGNG